VLERAQAFITSVTGAPKHWFVPSQLAA
jgi:hypothetical protein